ncbi:hypothetical protein ACP2AV_13695 [Aliiroseovarius sp. PTFE2010]|uniref:hypothetical protein n=1 Tax=Aliiroseovarius sp. PTFE2010 TaxID=3417190 RepID=UPI003CEC044D
MAFPHWNVYLGLMMLLRPICALFLALTITLTSGALALARGNTQVGVGQMALCTGSGTTIVTVDADGQPVGPSHYCPDCALGAFFMPQATAGALAVTPVASRLAVVALTPSFLSVETADPSARGPPGAL